MRRKKAPEANGKRPRRIRKLRLFTLLILVGLFCFVSFAYGMVLGIRSDIPQLEVQKSQRLERDGQIFDSSGKRVLAVLRGSESRVIVDSKDISPVMKQAIVAIEDQRFFEHRGVDLRGIIRAVWQDVRSKTGRPGRLDDHAAVRQEHLRPEQPVDQPQAEGGRARVAARAGVVEGQDPHRST